MEIDREKYYIVTYQYWYGCPSVAGHEFIQVYYKGFDSRKEAKEFMKKHGLDDRFEVRKGTFVIKRLKRDEKYVEGLGEGTWGYPPAILFSL